MASPKKKMKKTETKSPEGGASSVATSPLSRESKPSKNQKVFNDPIHGSMKFDRCLVEIIDTPQFQRLRNIKQLGGGYFVYPGASHNRFEHSLGVAHLAGELARSLQKNQPDLGIDERDIRCVEIAGLCHDLGHGPFSHMFDRTFIPKVYQQTTDKQRKKDLKGWEHEKASVQMFEHIVEKLKENGFVLEKKLKELSEEAEENKENNDLVFIKEMITGIKEKEPYKGRKENKRFLYDIVANKRNGIDVDKFDYFGRDCHHLGLKSSFDHCRFIQFARVCKVDGQLQICIRDKELSNIYEMFHTRTRLHQKAYQHKTKEIIELMITEAFLKADEKMKISSVINKDGAIGIDAYTELTDDLFGKILHSPDDGLKDAREILEKVISRKIYRYLGKTKNIKQKEENIKKWKHELAAAHQDDKVRLTENDFEIIISTISFGMKDQNPMDYLYFYSKSDETKAFKIPSEQVSEFLLPGNFSEDWIHVYIKPSDNWNIAYTHFYKWCSEKGFLLPQPPSDEGPSGATTSA